MEIEAPYSQDGTSNGRRLVRPSLHPSSGFYHFFTSAFSWWQTSFPISPHTIKSRGRGVIWNDKKWMMVYNWWWVWSEEDPPLSFSIESKSPLWISLTTYSHNIQRMGVKWRNLQWWEWDGMKTHSTSPPTDLPTHHPNQDGEYNVIMLEVERRKGQDDGNPWWDIQQTTSHHITINWVRNLVLRR